MAKAATVSAGKSPQGLQCMPGEVKTAACTAFMLSVTLHAQLTGSAFWTRCDTIKNDAWQLPPEPS